VSGNLIAFIFTLLFIAAALGEDYVLTLIYLFGGVIFAGRWWSQKALNAVSMLQLHESFSIELGVPGFFKRVVSLSPKAQIHFEYNLQGRKRGYYQVGPMVMQSGDVLGLFTSELKRRFEPEFLVVYPKIVPLTNIKIPSLSPLGTLRHTQPIFEDPTRILGKREYVVGDSMRRVDWKSSAALGSLQVKLFEPSIALETAIFLDLDEDVYNRRTRVDDSELAIVVAASIANWIAGARQSVGFYTNGWDSYTQDGSALSAPPRRGQDHLMKILESLARVGLTADKPLTALMRETMVKLPWGTTLILITGSMGDEMFDTLFQVRRAGLNALLVVVGRGENLQKVRQRASYFGFPIHQVTRERDLDIWRQ